MGIVGGSSYECWWSSYLSSLPIFFTFFTFLPPTYRFTTIYRFLPIFSQIYRILIFSTDLFVISCKLCSHKCYFHVLMVKSVKIFLYLNFQATCNVLAQWVKCRWLVVAHFLPQGNFQMLTGMDPNWRSTCPRMSDNNSHRWEYPVSHFLKSTQQQHQQCQIYTPRGNARPGILKRAGRDFGKPGILADGYIVWISQLWIIHVGLFRCWWHLRYWQNGQI